jgi:hypothetical protein
MSIYSISAIERVENNFNKKYETESHNCIIKILSGLDIENINDLVQELIMNCRYFPKPAEWQKALNESSIKRPNATQGGCKICKGKPWVDVCHTKHDGEVKSFRCSCRKNDPAYQTVRVNGKEIKLRFWSEELINHGFYLLAR